MAESPDYEKKFLRAVIYPHCDIPDTKSWVEESRIISGYALEAYNVLNEIGGGCRNAEEMIAKLEEEKEEKMEKIRKRKGQHISGAYTFEPAINSDKVVYQKSPSNIFPIIPEISIRKIYHGLNILKRAKLVEEDGGKNYILTDEGREYYENLTEMDLTAQVVFDTPTEPIRTNLKMKEIM